MAVGRAEEPPETLQGSDIPLAPGHNASWLTTTRQGGRWLSRLQLPWFTVRPPKGFGVLTTTGRNSGTPRPTCVRAVRDGNTVYLVAIGGDDAGWMKNVRKDPHVGIRIRAGRLRGVARELRDEERGPAETLYASFSGPFEYLESLAHLSGRPQRGRIEAMHRHWFRTGTPIAIDIGDV
jgi:deazaflavin-dependent oxidoreductase (nitroreductase family)